MENKRLLKIMRGAPGSGKSTAAKEMCDQTGTVRINFDLLREMLFFGQWSKENEKLVHAVAKAVAREVFKSGRDLVMDNVNLSATQTALNESIAKENSADIKVFDFTWVPINECIARDSKRGEKSVGRDVILKFWNDYIRPKESIVPYDPNLPDCIICDLDGTLASRVTDRNPFGGDRVYEDEVRQHVAEVIRSLIKTDHRLHLIFVSGREDIGICRIETERWLDEKTPFHRCYKLFMRKAGDHRKDYIIKPEIYEEHIKGKYNVAYVLEDRHCVAQAWDKIGLGDKLLRVGRVDADDF